MATEVERYFELSPQNCDRKTLALWVENNTPVHVRSPIYRRFGGKSINWLKQLQSIR